MLSIQLPAESLRCETLFWIDYVAEKEEVYCKYQKEWEHSRKDEYIRERKNYEKEFSEFTTSIPFCEIVLLELDRKLSERISLRVTDPEPDSVHCYSAEYNI